MQNIKESDEKVPPNPLSSSGFRFGMAKSHTGVDHDIDCDTTFTFVNGRWMGRIKEKTKNEALKSYNQIGYLRKSARYLDAFHGLRGLEEYLNVLSFISSNFHLIACNRLDLKEIGRVDVPLGASPVPYQIMLFIKIYYEYNLIMITYNDYVLEKRPDQSNDAVGLTGKLRTPVTFKQAVSYVFTILAAEDPFSKKDTSFPSVGIDISYGEYDPREKVRKEALRSAQKGSLGIIEATPPSSSSHFEVSGVRHRIVGGGHVREAIPTNTYEVARVRFNKDKVNHWKQNSRPEGSIGSQEYLYDSAEEYYNADHFVHNRHLKEAAEPSRYGE